MTIALSARALPIVSATELYDHGYAVVHQSELTALEEAKARYEQAWFAHTGNRATPHFSAQQATEPVAQQNTQKPSQSVVLALAEDNARLTAENNKLRAEFNALAIAIEQYKGEAHEPR